jgi:hypothetical protein
MKKAAESVVKHKIQDFLYENVTAKWQKTMGIFETTSRKCYKQQHYTALRHIENNSYTLLQAFLSAITAFK